MFVTILADGEDKGEYDVNGSEKSSDMTMNQITTDMNTMVAPAVHEPDAAIDVPEHDPFLKMSENTVLNHTITLLFAKQEKLESIINSKNEELEAYKDH